MPKGAQRVQGTGKHRTSTSALTFSTPVQASSGLLEAQKGRSAGLSRPWPRSHSRRVAKRHQRGGKKSRFHQIPSAVLRGSAEDSEGDSVGGGLHPVRRHMGFPGNPQPSFPLTSSLPSPSPQGRGADPPAQVCVCEDRRVFTPGCAKEVARAAGVQGGRCHWAQGGGRTG